MNLLFSFLIDQKRILFHAFLFLLFLREKENKLRKTLDNIVCAINNLAYVQVI